jgi:hypothetical protein
MFNYLITAPNKEILLSRSETNAPYKVIALKNDRWDSYASSADYAGAWEALETLSGKFSRKGFTNWQILVATPVDYATWSAAMDAKGAN